MVQGDIPAAEHTQALLDQSLACEKLNAFVKLDADHVFLCMLFHYVEWHIHRKLAPLLFQDDDPEGAQTRWVLPIGKAEVSGRVKADTLFTPEGWPVHSFPMLLDDLSSVALNRVRMPGGADSELAVVTTPTRLQARAFELLDVNPGQSVPIRMTSWNLVPKSECQ